MMSESTFVLLSGAVSFGAPLALAIRELYVLRRPPPGDWPPPPPPAVPKGPKPLPDCLVPRPAPRRRVDA